MKLAKAAESMSLVTVLKRVASAYVIDYRNLTEEEIRAALIKTGPQYYNEDNLARALNECFLLATHDVSILSHLILVNVLLNKDDFICPSRELDDDVVELEQEIVNKANEDLIRKNSDRRQAFETFRFVLETAWQNNNSISVDERNLIEKLRRRLKISPREYRIVEAQLGKFPKIDNLLHTKTEIDEVRRLLQTKGLMFSVRDDEGIDYDVIPEEIGKSLRNLLCIEMKEFGYKELLGHKNVRNKAYLTECIKKIGLVPEPNSSLEELQNACLDHVSPSIVLGGISPKDGLEISVLKSWCQELQLIVSGTKPEVIVRILEFYDNLHQRDETPEDERAVWYDCYERLAARDIEFLRGQQLIFKDNEIEKKFEHATDYLFEKKLNHKPLTMAGSNHCDGTLSYKDMFIMWDNKSKERVVSLKDHLRQFDGYIRGSEKRVACFLVIANEFTPDSSLLSMQYNVENGVIITLIKAADLKVIAEKWDHRDKSKNEDPFPLGYLIQPGIFNPQLVPI